MKLKIITPSGDEYGQFDSDWSIKAMVGAKEFRIQLKANAIKITEVSGESITIQPTSSNCIEIK